MASYVTTQVTISGENNQAMLFDEPGIEVLLGQLSRRYRMQVDVVLEDRSGRRILIDTKHKSLHRQRSPAQSDFYQMLCLRHNR